MPDIVHQLLIKAPVVKVFNRISTPEGIERNMVVKECQSIGRLWFGPEYDWYVNFRIS